jgi:hypothetical protein
MVAVLTIMFNAGLANIIRYQHRFRWVRKGDCNSQDTHVMLRNDDSVGTGPTEDTEQCPGLHVVQSMKESA